VDTERRPNPDPPFDFQTSNRFKCGSTDADFYKILMTGLDGSPMPSWSDNLKPDEAWDVIFYAGQWVAWTQLRSQGMYLATNPSSSFFYVLTVPHAVHILGCLCSFAYVIRKLRRGSLQKSTLNAMSRYWHLSTSSGFICCFCYCWKSRTQEAL
jgi:hypothetical protein